MIIQENVALAPLTTFRVGGPARYLVEAHSAQEVREATEFSRTKNLPLFILGGGSNLVVAESGWPGLVLKITSQGIDRRDNGSKILFDVAAGESWDDFVAHAVATNCAGVECLSGIPGTVGGTPVQNVGAYGQEVSQTIESVRVFDFKNQQVRDLSNEACKFSYRSSMFNATERGRFVILRVTYALNEGGEPHLEYADLKKHFAAWTTRPTLEQTREAVCHIRAQKGMLIVPGDPDCQSAGSFFKNPVVSAEQHADLVARAQAKGLILPSYPALKSQRKVSAAWLVEKSGFSRGYQSGRVGLSSKHALAIVNRGGARAEEVIVLKQQIQDRVYEMWGVTLETEPVMVGF